jgi:dihydrofolate reductase
MNDMIDETGAVVMGRRSFEMPDDPDTIADNYEFQVPIFVVTNHPPETTPKENDRLTFTFVTEGVEPAVAQAKVAAGEKAVTVVGGVDVIRQLLHAGLVDELRVDVMPVLLGGGLRFLDDPSLAHLELEKIGVEQVGERTSLRFRVQRK